MPATDVLDSEMVQERAPGHEWTLPELIDAAKPFGVSVESFLRRLVTLGRVPIEFYRASGRAAPSATSEATGRAEVPST
jgi:Zn-dependent peptidase ImmA (M78 family)